MDLPVSLNHTLPHVDSLTMESEGLFLWIMGASEDDSILPQLTEDYGGVLVEKKNSHQLWFFFSNNACLVAARLRSWSRFAQSQVFVQIFKAVLRVGYDGQKAISLGESIRNQKLTKPEQPQIWVHPSAFESFEKVLGLSLVKAPLARGMSDDGWQLLEADSRLPYQPAMGWYGVIRGVGVTGDRNFQIGWREFYPHLEAILQRSKIRYNNNNYFLMFLVEGVRQFRSLCKEMAITVDRVRKVKPQEYWPYVGVFVDRKGFSFNDELPHKVGVDWQHLIPEFPHMSKRSALILGEEFSFHEDRFSHASQSEDDWCSVSLNAESNLSAANKFPNLIPSMSLGEHQPCFYCGHRSHTAAECPTRLMSERDQEIWRLISFLDLNAMRDASRSIDKQLPELETDTLMQLMRQPAPAGYLLRGSFDIGWPGQLRSIPFFWLARDKNLGEQAKKAEKNNDRNTGSPAWAYLASFAEKEPARRESDLLLMANNAVRDFRVTCLRGFSAMEAGEYKKAIQFWHDAELSSSYPVVAAWHVFLQARAYECMCDFAKAIDLYDHVVRTCPRWSFALYRKSVCYIKQGFASAPLSDFMTIVLRDGNYFNKILLDPELDRGHIQVFNCLVNMWHTAEERSNGEEARLRGLANEVQAWLATDNPFAVTMSDRINSLLQMSKIENYVTMQVIVNGRMELEKDLQDHVNAEAARLKQLFQNYSVRLQEIRDEAAWFPFPGFLKEFNAVFNRAAFNANWVFKANLGQPDSFRKAQKLAEEVENDVQLLQSRMRSLLMIRDATLFLLVLIETFFWLEVVGFVLVFAILPLVEIYGSSFGMDWTAKYLAGQRGEVQKALFIVISICAMGLAGMRTVLRFEKIRAKVLQKAKNAPLKQKNAKPAKKKAKAKARGK